MALLRPHPGLLTTRHPPLKMGTNRHSFPLFLVPSGPAPTA